MKENFVDYTNDDKEHLEEFQKIIEVKDKLIKKQFIRIEALEYENAILSREKDALVSEINKLKFQLEMSQLKRHKDEREETSQQYPPLEATTPNKIAGFPQQQSSISVDLQHKKPCFDTRGRKNTDSQLCRFVLNYIQTELRD
ncbi:uncharacterized protein LOC143235993 [Tachypleus tridentatus]|uniref:uncharacterized protein LOC143235993 n=1 Tax=Tachypleus tridentatus TaxID=6853 RepID=UPI003FCF1A6D